MAGFFFFSFLFLFLFDAPARFSAREYNSACHRRFAELRGRTSGSAAHAYNEAVKAAVKLLSPGDIRLNCRHDPKSRGGVLTIKQPSASVNRGLIYRVSATPGGGSPAPLETWI